MLAYFGAIWQCRHFWMSLVRSDLRTRYRRSLLGIGWSLLNPICMTTILCIVFHKLFHQNVEDYAPHLLAGFACWNYFTGCVTLGSQSFFQGESYIRQCPMPLAIYPLRVVLGASFHFLIAIGLVVVFVIGLGLVGYRPLHPESVLAAVPGMLMLFVTCWGIAILAGLANVFFQDTQHLLEVFLQMYFYATPIIYKSRMLEDHGLGWAVRYNPAVIFLKLIREPILEGTVPSTSTYVAGLFIVAVVCGLATGLMARYQKQLIFHL